MWRKYNALLKNHRCEKWLQRSQQGRNKSCKTGNALQSLRAVQKHLSNAKQLLHGSQAFLSEDFQFRDNTSEIEIDVFGFGRAFNPTRKSRAQQGRLRENRAAPELIPADAGSQKLHADPAQLPHRLCGD